MKEVHLASTYRGWLSRRRSHYWFRVDLLLPHLLQPKIYPRVKIDARLKNHEKWRDWPGMFQGDELWAKTCSFLGKLLHNGLAIGSLFSVQPKQLFLNSIFDIFDWCFELYSLGKGEFSFSCFCLNVMCVLLDLCLSQSDVCSNDCDLFCSAWARCCSSNCRPWIMSALSIWELNLFFLDKDFIFSGESCVFISGLLDVFITTAEWCLKTLHFYFLKRVSGLDQQGWPPWHNWVLHEGGAAILLFRLTHYQSESESGQSPSPPASHLISLNQNTGFSVLFYFHILQK